MATKLKSQAFDSTAKPLRHFEISALGSNYTTPNDTNENTVLQITLPVLSSGTYLLIARYIAYVTTGSGNNDFSIRLGTSTTPSSNTAIGGGSYVGGAKTLESLYGVGSSSGVDLSVQKYLQFTIRNDAGNGASFSATRNRTSLEVMILG